MNPFLFNRVSEHFEEMQVVLAAAFVNNIHIPGSHSSSFDYEYPSGGIYNHSVCSGNYVEVNREMFHKFLNFQYIN